MPDSRSSEGRWREGPSQRPAGGAEGKWIIGITGASGVAYAIRLVEVLIGLRKPLYLIVSQAAKLVFKEETSVVWREDGATIGELWGPAAYEWVTVLKQHDLAAPIASGSHPVEGMIVVPCSMGSLASIAHGTAANLIHRSADVMLKEGRPLLLVPRETPLSTIHLENLLAAKRAGATIIPAMPGFYAGAKTMEDLVDFVVGKVLDQAKIPHQLFRRWKEEPDSNIFSPRSSLPGAGERQSEGETKIS